MFADLVILNGTICTVDRLFSYCQAVAVRQGIPVLPCPLPSWT